MKTTDIVNYAGHQIPAICFPDGTKVELNPDILIRHPHRACVELNRWLDKWCKSRIGQSIIEDSSSQETEGDGN